MCVCVCVCVCVDIKDRTVLCYSVKNLLNPSNKETVDCGQWAVGSVLIVQRYSVHLLYTVRTDHSACNRFMTVYNKAEM